MNSTVFIIIIMVMGVTLMNITQKKYKIKNATEIYDVVWTIKYKCGM